MIKPVKALAAFLALLALLVGIPAGLLVFYGNPIPGQVPSGGDVLSLLTSNDTLGFLLFVIVWIGWIAWASFALSVIIELGARARHIEAPRLRGFGAQQGAAAVLITAIAGIGAPAAMADTPAEMPAEHHIQTEAPAVPTEQSPAESTDSQHTPSAPVASNSDLVVTVQPGDTAWDLAAQHLGDGLQWRTIIDANAGIAQPDGGSLDPEKAQHLETGWKLRIPGVPAPSTDQASPQHETVTVEQGQSLSTIAQDRLGDPDRWPEIFDASTDITQPNGAHLTNPDQIDQGWSLNVPASAATTATAEKSERPVEDPTPSTSSEEGPASDADAQKPAEEDANELPEATDETPQAEIAPPVAEAPPAEADEEAADSSTVPWAGIGSIFAASIMSTIIARRIHTQRKRREDQRVPAAAIADLDTVRLTRIEDPTVLGFIDRALRTLSALQLRDDKHLPDVRLARMTETHLELYAADAHHLPSPFEATDDPATWLLPRTAPLADDDTLADILAPYPALVTIGTDASGHQILVDLEHLAALGIQATAQTSMPVMRALTVSLATSHWADDLTLTTVGVCPELESALDSGRIIYRDTVAELLDGLEAKLAHDQGVLIELGHDSAQHARQAPNPSDLWAPEIIIIGTDLSLTEQHRLQKIVGAQPQIAVAVISSDQHTELSEWRMHIKSLESARLEPLGLELTPQHLTDADYDAVLRALNTASHLESTTVVPEDKSYEAAEPQLRAVPSRPNQPLLTAEQRDTAPDLPTDHPYIRVLGPVEVVGATGTLETKRLSELTETAAYVYLYPGSPETNFIADLWGKRVADGTRHQRISRLRRWLGATEDGTSYLERAEYSNGGYHLTEHITSDWAYAQEIHKERTTATNEQLADALKLVRGIPFDGPGRSRYSWANGAQFTATDAILDLSHELCHRALEAGDTDTTLWAAQQGLLAQSLNEQAWRYRLRAACNDPDLHSHITHELEALTTDEDYELEPDTEALMYPTPARQRTAS